MRTLQTVVRVILCIQSTCAASTLALLLRLLFEYPSDLQHAFRGLESENGLVLVDNYL